MRPSKFNKALKPPRKPKSTLVGANLSEEKLLGAVGKLITEVKETMWNSCDHQKTMKIKRLEEWYCIPMEFSANFKANRNLKLFLHNINRYKSNHRPFSSILCTDVRVRTTTVLLQSSRSGTSSISAQCSSLNGGGHFTCVLTRGHQHHTIKILSLFLWCIILIARIFNFLMLTFFFLEGRAVVNLKVVFSQAVNLTQKNQKA